MSDAPKSRLRIEVDCSAGWELASEADTDASIDQIALDLRHLTDRSKQPHRAFLNGVQVACLRPRGR